MSSYAFSDWLSENYILVHAAQAHRSVPYNNAKVVHACVYITTLL